MILSIIIPLYNSEKYIKKTLDNILLFENADKDIEIVLIDDGSTDLTPAICEDYSRQFDFINYYSKKNGGIADARNFGIKKAHADYLFFHDHDDLFEIDNIKNILEVISSNKADLFLFNSSIVKDGEKESFITINNVSKEGFYLNENDINKLIEIQFKNVHDGCFINRFGLIWSVVIRRQFVVEHNLCFKTYCDFDDDFNFLIEVLIEGAQIYASPISIYNWFIYHNSTSHGFVNYNDYISKIIKYEDYLFRLLDKSKIDYRTKKVLVSNIIWIKSESLVVNYLKASNNRKEFIDLFKDNKYLRTVLTRKVSLKKTKNQNILVFLVFLNLYNLIYFALKNRRLKK